MDPADHTAGSIRSGGTRPDAASTPIARCSALSRSIPSAPTTGDACPMVKNVTTQSPHATGRAVQLSQSIIMRRTLVPPSDISSVAGPDMGCGAHFRFTRMSATLCRYDRRVLVGGLAAAGPARGHAIEHGERGPS